MASGPIKQEVAGVTPAEEMPDRDLIFWKREVERAEKYFNTFWQKGDQLYKKFAKDKEGDDGKRKFAMLWANTEVLKPAVYARPPVPQVSRRYRDKDPVGRIAAEMLERGASYEFERMDIDAVLRAVRDDMLLPGRGAAWLRYEADIEGDSYSEPEGDAEPNDQPTEEMGEPMMPQVKSHRVVCDYVHYRQFLHSPSRRWEEVWWVGKITYMSAESGIARFGREAWAGVELDNKPDSATTGGDEFSKDPALVNAQEGKATVYEVWSKRHKKVFFFAKASKRLLAVDDPLLNFENFFPCPKPVYSTLTNNSLIPTPDYKYYQDQAEEIDQLTDRIDKLTDSLKLVGFYPAGGEGDVTSAIQKALSPDTQSTMIPIASWAAFGERGGSNAIIWLPIKDVVETIKACVDLRNQLVQDTYQITGISDILRGATDANETATAQSIKAQWGSIRIQDRQNELARFARDITRMTCEIIAEEFDPEFVMQMANMQKAPPPEPPALPPPSSPPQPSGDPQQDEQAAQAFQQQQAQVQQVQQAFQQQMQKVNEENGKLDQAFQLLKDERLRCFRIDIETDSTVQPDEDAEKERRTEFVTAIGGILQQAVPLVMQVPELAPLVSETLLFTARGFRAGRQLEDSIEQALQAVQDRLQQALSQQPADPAAQQDAAKAKAMEQETQHKAQMNQMEAEHTATMNDLELQKAHVQHQLLMGAKAEDLMMKRKAGEQKLGQDKAKADMMAAAKGGPPQPGDPSAPDPNQIVQQMLAAVLQSNQQIMQALSAPKTITAPDGRTYTAQTHLN